MYRLANGSLFAAVAAAVAGTIVLTAQQGGGQPNRVQAPIRLRAATFTPTRGEAPAIPPGLAISGYTESQRGYYIVQFDGPVVDSWKADVAAIGVELLDYVPDFAFKARMTPGQARQVERQASVVWVGLFHPAYKLAPDLVRNGASVYTVQIERGANAAAAGAAIAAAGAQVLARDGSTLTVMAGTSQLDALAHVLDVASVENLLLRKRRNEFGGGGIMGASTANSHGFDGSTQTIAIADTGLGNGSASDAFVDIAPIRISAMFNWPGAAGGCFTSITDDGAVDVDSGHGTHTTTSALGFGGPAGQGRGTAPAAHLVFQAVENWATTSNFCKLFYGAPDGYYLVGIPADIGQLFQQGYNSGARVHSNSWGSDAAGAYTTDSVNADDFIWNHGDMTITFSAGNAGTDANGDGIIDGGSMGSPATAKNVVSVGASENDRQGQWGCDTGLTYTNCAAQGGQNTIFTYGAAWPGSYPANPIKDDPSAGNAEQMAAFSSRGPASDGRIKPDLVAPGTWVLSGYSDKFQQQYDPSPNPKNGLYQYDGWGYPLNQYYKYLGGTSMSNPLVAGGAAVVRDFYQKTTEHNASAALVKATLVNSAVDLLDENNDGLNDNAYPIPNSHEGWGRVDLAGATDGARQFVDGPTLITNGSATYSYSVGTPGSAFKATLAWSDFPSTTSAAKNLVNDLDLLVTAPDGMTTYRGNVFAGGWSLTGGSADRTNNLENVYVQSAVAGTWTVEVRGFNVPNGPQPFALVVDAAFGPPPPPPPPAAPGNLIATAASSSRIDLSWADLSSNEIGFAIERCESSGCLTFAPIAQVGANVTSFSDATVAANTTYVYRVQAFNAGGSSDYSNSAEATTPAAPTPPAPPSNLGAAAVSTSQINLSWSDNSSDETGFEIERCQGAACSDFANIAQVAADAVSYSDSGLSASTTYQYRVRAINAGGASDYSNSAETTTPAAPTPPAPPSNLGAAAVSTSQINLSWSDNSSDETGFEIERCQGAACSNFANIAQVAADTVSYSDSGLLASTTYQYRVRAINAGGASDYSNTASATTETPPESHVGDLDGSATNTKNTWQATVTITVHDFTHTVVVGAPVSGTWSGGYSASASCTTNTAGQCSVATGSMSRSRSSVTFTVGNITHGTLTYTAASNHDPDGDSNGTSITVLKP